MQLSSGDDMTIGLPGATKLGLAGLLSRKHSDGRDGKSKLSADKLPLKPHEIAKRFSHNGASDSVKPAKLNESEKRDRDRLSSLRGALYSKD